MITYPRVPLSQVSCPTLPLFASGQQSVSCEGGTDLFASVPLPSNLNIDGPSLVLDPGAFVSRKSQADADNQALDYLEDFFADGIASGDLICLGNPSQSFPSLICGAVEIQLVGWWKADSLNLADGTPVGGAGATWTDSSGNGHTYVQSDPALRPTFRTNIFGNRPALLFDNVDDLLECSSFTYGDSPAAPTTYIVIFKRTSDDSAPDNYDTLLGRISDTLRISIGKPFAASPRQAALTNGPFIHVYNSSNFDDPIGSLTALCHRNCQTDSHNIFSEDISNKGPTAFSSSGLNFNTIGRAGAGSSGNWQAFGGYIAEVLVYSGYLSDTQWASLYNTYLKIKYPGLP